MGGQRRGGKRARSLEGAWDGRVLWVDSRLFLVLTYCREEEKGHTWGILLALKFKRS